MWYFKVAIDSASGYNRLVDDVFSRICQAINDVQESVRCLAAQTIGSMTKVKHYKILQNSRVGTKKPNPKNPPKKNMKNPN